MSPGPATIDLGLVSHDTPPEPDPPWPVRDRLRRLHHRFGGRGMGRVAGVAIGLALVLATAAAAPATPPLIRHFTVDHANAVFAYQEHLYAVRDASDGLGIVIAGYHLDSGELRWETTLPGQPDNTWLAELDGALLVYALAAEFDQEVARLDADSGEVLWTHHGSVVGNGGGRLLLAGPLASVAENEDGWYEFQNDYAPREITAVDLATGEPVWTGEIMGWEVAVTTGDPASVVTLTPDGGLVSYALATGERLATASVDTARSGPTGIFSLMEIGSMALVTVTEDAGRSGIVAYDAVSLTRLWTFTGSTGADQYLWANSCGALVCLSGIGPPQALDPATGETVWMADWIPVEDELDSLTVYHPGPADAGYLVLDLHDPSGDLQTSWLIEPETGEPMLALADWSGGLDASVPPAGAAAPVLVERDDGSTWVGRIRPDLSGVDPLMALPSVPPDGCWTHTSYVVCGPRGLAGGGQDPQSAEVWRLR